MTKITVSFEIDDAALGRMPDQKLATLWHVAQANPAPHTDKAAGEVVEHIGREIIRRWLQNVPPELWKHKGDSYYWKELTRFARYVPPEGCRLPGGPSFDDGEWVAKDSEDPADARAMATEQTSQNGAPS